MADQLAHLKAALADRYAIERELGRGGMATVYLATDLRHRRPVALKVLRPEIAQSLGSERFLREIQVAAQLNHPHILPLFDSGRIVGSADRGIETAGVRSDDPTLPRSIEFLYYAMPYVEGESLRELLTRAKQLPVEDALRIAREVADALSYAHGRGLIHRDIKPENILLQAGHAVVADFGIARAITEAGGTRLTETGLAVGTPAYMSPEQAAGSGELDGRSDLYALGCVLYEMLAGEPPFTGPTVESLVHQHLAVEPRTITAIRPAVPAQVATAVDRSLAKAPADRFQSAAAFAGAIAQPTATVPVAEPRLFHRRLVPPIAIGLVVIAAVALWVLRPWREQAATAGDGGTASRVVVLPYENRTGDPALDPVGQMVAEWITEGLMQTGAVQVVPNFMTLEAVAQSRDGGGLLERVARRTQSSIAVTGSYYRNGEQLEFHSEVVDVASGTSFARIDPISGTARDPRGAIDSVRIQVMGALAIRLSRDLGWELPAGVQPPTYDAARAYERAMREWVRAQYDSAATLFERAYALDTTYLRSLLVAAAGYGNAGDRRRSDSLIDVIQARRDELSPYDRYRVAYLAANHRGDNEGALAAARAGVELVPFGTARWAFVGALVGVNRPREALAVLEGIDASLLEVIAAWDYIWRSRTEVLHLLGQHERELEVARESRDYLAGPLFAMSYEGTAIAALGRIEDLMRLTEEIQLAAPVPTHTPGDVLMRLAEEVRAHGHRATALEVVDRALQWHDEQSAAYRVSVAGRSLLGHLLYARERWDDADTVFAALEADSANLATALGRQGTVAARRGDVAAARRFSDALAELPQREQLGRNTAWRARIAALLGDAGDAVALLRRAFSEGLHYGIWLHRDVDLEGLRDYAPFRELMKPKG